MLPADYVHMKEIITADATEIPVGDQVTQPTLRLLKILSQVFVIQRCFLKKKIILGFAHPKLFHLLLWFLPQRDEQSPETQGEEVKRREISE